MRSHIYESGIEQKLLRELEGCLVLLFFEAYRNSWLHCEHSTWLCSRACVLIRTTKANGAVWMVPISAWAAKTATQTWRRRRNPAWSRAYRKGYVREAGCGSGHMCMLLASWRGCFCAGEDQSGVERPHFLTDLLLPGSWALQIWDGALLGFICPVAVALFPRATEQPTWKAELNVCISRALLSLSPQSLHC